MRNKTRQHLVCRTTGTWPGKAVGGGGGASESKGLRCSHTHTHTRTHTFPGDIIAERPVPQLHDVHPAPKHTQVTVNHHLPSYGGHHLLACLSPKQTTESPSLLSSPPGRFPAWPPHGPTIPAHPRASSPLRSPALRRVDPKRELCGAGSHPLHPEALTALPPCPR